MDIITISVGYLIINSIAAFWFFSNLGNKGGYSQLKAMWDGLFRVDVWALTFTIGLVFLPFMLWMYATAPFIAIKARRDKRKVEEQLKKNKEAIVDEIIRKNQDV